MLLRKESTYGELSTCDTARERYSYDHLKEGISY